MDRRSIGTDQIQYTRLVIDLENAFRSRAIKDQLRAILRVPRLLDEQPFPEFVSSAFVRLAEFFAKLDDRSFQRRMFASSQTETKDLQKAGYQWEQLIFNYNVTRYFIYKVFKQSDKHFVKNINVDKIVMTIFIILGNQSNDPIARSLTLRTLGCLSPLLTERLNVQHGIIQRLDSHVLIEANAAIYAADNICSRSETFSTILCEKLANMVRADHVSLTIKLKLIRVFRHMHWNLDLAHKVELLFEYVLGDSREKVISRGLTDLTMLARKDVTFHTTHALKLLDIISTAAESTIRVKALHVLTILFQRMPLLSRIMSTDFDIETRRQALEHFGNCEKLLIESEHEMALAVLRLFVVVVTEVDRIKSIPSESISPEWVALPMKAIQYLRCLLSVCSIRARIVDSIERDLLNLIRTDGEGANLLAKFLLILSEDGILNSQILPELLTLLESDEFIEKPQLFATLMRTVLRSASNVMMLKNERAAIVNNVKVILDKFGSWSDSNYHRNQWYLYTIGREAGKRGYHEIMKIVMKSLYSQVESERSRFWLEALMSVAEAETNILVTINGETLNLGCLSHAVNLYTGVYYKLGAMAASAKTFHNRRFQEWFIQLRSEFVQIIQRTLLLLNHPSFPVWSQPSRTQMFMSIDGCLSDLACRFNFCAHSFLDIEEESVSVDTINGLDPLLLPLIRYATADPNNNMKYKIELQKGKSGGFHSRLVTSCIQIIQMVMNWVRIGNTADVIAPVREAIRDIIQIPLTLPPFFFSNYNHTHIQWTTAPEWKTSINNFSMYEPKRVSCNEKLILRIDGIIHPGQYPTQRSIKQVQVTVFGSRMNYEHLFIKTSLETAMKFSSAAAKHATANIANERQLEVCQPTVCTVTNNNNFFTCTALITFLRGKM
ncbi:10951_t:CDS:10, partial [Paraglomus brasilianum]